MGLLGAVLDGLLLLLLVGAIASLVVRFRRSQGVERQQLKWFTYAGALVLLAPLSSELLPSLGNAPYVVVIVLPIAVGIAVLRYRLYDIDRLINRTLVYGWATTPRTTSGGARTHISDAAMDLQGMAVVAG